MWANQLLIKETISYLKHKIEILIANIFQERKMFHQIVVLFETLTQAVILSSTSNFFATIAPLCNDITSSSQKMK